MKTYFLTAVFLFSLFSDVIGQDTSYAREVIQKLSSQEFAGRGYVDQGDRKAARYIREAFKKHGVRPVVDEYFQHFTININTFPDKLKVRIGGKKLEPGSEFLVNCNSGSDKGKYNLFWLNAEEGNLDSLAKVAAKHDLSDKFVVTANPERKITEENFFNAAGIVVLQKKLWWHVSNGNQVKDFTVLKVKKTAIDEDADKIRLNIQNRFLENYKTQNVLGYIPGRKHPEKFFFVTAHYDHLGKMGPEVYFPGANDNASGTAMMMDLARYYSNNPPDISIVFIAFGAEETGLHGSRYFSQNIPFPKDNVLFSLNLDMVGTGSAGVNVVNGRILHEYFNTLIAINKKEDYLKKVGKRGGAANSDHYFIYKAGIPAFFIYTKGNEFREYHNLADKGEDVPLTEYENLFRLIKDYISQFPLKSDLIR